MKSRLSDKFHPEFNSEYFGKYFQEINDPLTFFLYSFCFIMPQSTLSWFFAKNSLPFFAKIVHCLHVIFVTLHYYSKNALFGVYYHLPKFVSVVLRDYCLIHACFKKREGDEMKIKEIASFISITFSCFFFYIFSHKRNIYVLMMFQILKS